MNDATIKAYFKAGKKGRVFKQGEPRIVMNDEQEREHDREYRARLIRLGKLTEGPAIEDDTTDDTWEGEND